MGFFSLAIEPPENVGIRRMHLPIQFQTRLDVPQIPLLLQGLQKVANRIFSGVVLAGILIASAMLLPHQRPLGTVGFILAGALGLWMVVTILWTDRHRRE